MRKFVAAIAAVALSACLATGAFAEATPGEAAQETAVELQEALVGLDGTPVESGQVKEILSKGEAFVAALTDTSVTITEAQAQVGRDMLSCLYLYIPNDDSIPGHIVTSNNMAATGATDVSITGYQASEGQYTINSISVTTDQANNTVNVNVSTSGTPSSLGYFVRFDIPGVQLTGTYKIRYVDENGNELQPSDAVVTPYKQVNSSVVEFWVPHFSTWQLYKVSDDAAVSSENTASATNTSAASSADDDEWTYCPACGHNHWTATAEGYKCDNCGHIVTTVKSTSGVKGTYVPAASSENPIKKTGMDMDAGLFALIALAGAAVAGCAYGVKKFAMNK